MTDGNAEGQGDDHKLAWDSVADSYSSNITHFTSLHAFDLITAIKPHLLSSTTRTVLDVGCGTAAFAHAYLRHFPHGIPGQTVICTDVSPAMVEVARNTITHLLPTSGFDTVFEFRVEDATALDGVPDASVQAVVSIFCVFLIPQRDAVFEQIKRVSDMAANPVFATTAWCALPGSLDASLGFGSAFDSAIWAIMTICHPDMFVGKDKSAFDDPPHGDWRDPIRAKHLVTKAGFSNVRAMRVLHTAGFQDAGTFWKTMTTSNPMVDISGRSADEVAKLRQVFMTQMGLSDDGTAFAMVTACNIIVGMLSGEH